VVGAAPPPPRPERWSCRAGALGPRRELGAGCEGGRSCTGSTPRRAGNQGGRTRRSAGWTPPVRLPPPPLFLLKPPSLHWTARMVPCGGTGGAAGPRDPQSPQMRATYVPARGATVPVLPTNGPLDQPGQCSRARGRACAPDTNSDAGTRNVALPCSRAPRRGPKPGGPCVSSVRCHPQGWQTGGAVRHSRLSLFQNHPRQPARAPRASLPGPDAACSSPGAPSRGCRPFVKFEKIMHAGGGASGMRAPWAADSCCTGCSCFNLHRPRGCAATCASKNLHRPAGARSQDRAARARGRRAHSSPQQPSCLVARPKIC